MGVQSGLAAVIYASKYGSTAEYAKVVAEVLGVVAMPVGRVKEVELDGAGLIVLGSPIYGPAVLPEMAGFLERYGHLLRRRKIAAFVVCGDTLWSAKSGEGGHRNIDKLNSLLPGAPVAQVVLGGRMRMEDLDEEDLPRILAFYRRLGREPLGFNRMDLEAARAWAREVKRKYLMLGS